MTFRTTFRGAFLALAALCTALTMSACSDNSPTDNDDDGQGTPITAQYYIQATMNGKTVTYQTSALSNGQIGQAMNGSTTSDGPKVSVIQEYAFNKATYANGDFVVDTLADCPRITLIKNFDDTPYDEELDELISPTMQFGNERTRTDGVQIAWTDGNGKRWCSSWGSGDQAGSSFTVTEHTKIEYQIGQPLGGRYNSKGTFNCTLYDAQGNSMTVKNGKFSLQTVFE